MRTYLKDGVKTVLDESSKGSLVRNLSQRTTVYSNLNSLIKEKVKYLKTAGVAYRESLGISEFRASLFTAYVEQNRGEFDL